MEETMREIPDASMTVTAEALLHLNTIRKWTLFLSLLGFAVVTLGIIILLAMTFFLALGNLDENFPAGPFSPFLIFVVALLVCFVYFFPLYYLYKFSRVAHTVILTKDPATLTTALRYLKNHYIVIGTLTIAGIVLYVLFFLAAMIVAVLR